MDNSWDLSSPQQGRYTLSTHINHEIIPPITSSKTIPNHRVDKFRNKKLSAEEIKPITRSESASSFGISLKVANYGRNSVQSFSSSGSVGATSKSFSSSSEKRPNTAPTRQPVYEKKVSFTEAQSDGRNHSSTSRPTTTTSAQKKGRRTPTISPNFVDYKRFVKPFSESKSTTTASSNNTPQGQYVSNGTMSSGKMKALSVEMEVHLLENIERLKEIEENEFVLRQRYKQLYSDTFDEIIKVCPFGKLLRVIKDAYDKDALIADKAQEKQHYDELVILYTNAQNNLSQIEKEFKLLQKENIQLKSELKKQKSDCQRYKTEIERLTQLQADIVSNVKPELRNLLNKKEKTQNTSRSSIQGLTSLKRNNTSPKSLRPETSAKSRLFNQDKDTMESDTKELKERDRLFELESELTKTILKERELTREIALINLEREKDEVKLVEKKEEKSDSTSLEFNEENNMDGFSQGISRQSSMNNMQPTSQGDQKEGSSITSSIEDEESSSSLREKLLRTARQQRLQESVAQDLDYTDPSIAKKQNHGVPPIITSTTSGNTIISMKDLKENLSTNTQSMEPINLMFRSDSMDSFSLDYEDM
ncbi:hypothetical protein C9374_003771 [Naegleria lovaniensis]|uniref:Uncharacterized protein n=1 Tax=Naegleria lovaniensis TaxID=51637 RepID=A0AA88H892_NAELO|nr:uncharacterized protein C9374_003771 [Naegleria lovaniensis]KAG2394007.1 hypothetical protein C9374_003771 [Naegleria lovaniensis]